MKDDSVIEIYQDPEQGIQVGVKLTEESVWATQRQMAELFGTEVPAISKHIKNIYSSGELLERATLSKMETVQNEGKRLVSRSLDHYNLDIILSVGYRVNSQKGTQFRIWANQVLKGYLLKGYAINEKRLQQKAEQLEELKKVVELQSRVLANHNLERHRSRRPGKGDCRIVNLISPEDKTEKAAI